MVRSTCSLASGWKLISVAPALAKSGTMRSTGLTIRCTSIGAVHAVLAQRLAHQRADGQVRHVVVVHHVEVHPVGAGREHVVHFLAQAGEVGGKDGWGDDAVGHGGSRVLERLRVSACAALDAVVGGVDLARLLLGLLRAVRGGAGDLSGWYWEISRR